MEALDGQDIDDLVDPDDDPEHDSGEDFDSESGEDSIESEEECQRPSLLMHYIYVVIVRISLLMSYLS